MPGDTAALNGTWMDQWGKVELSVDGEDVKGTWSQGTLAGKAGADGTLALTWTHRDGTTGQATLKPSDDSSTLAGHWTWDGDAAQGEWTLSQIKRAAPPKKAEPKPEEPAPAPAPAPEPAPTPDAPPAK